VMSSCEGVEGKARLVSVGCGGFGDGVELTEGVEGIEGIGIIGAVGIESTRKVGGKGLADGAEEVDESRRKGGGGSGLEDDAEER